MADLCIGNITVISNKSTIDALRKKKDCGMESKNSYIPLCSPSNEGGKIKRLQKEMNYQKNKCEVQKIMTEPLRYRHSSVGIAQTFRKAMTDGEQKLWSRLRGKQLEYYFRRQTPIGKYIVDFVCWKEKLVVEVDGSQHYTPMGKGHDRIRDQFLQHAGFRIMRFNSVEVLNNTDGILEMIYDNLKNPLSSS